MKHNKYLELKEHQQKEVNAFPAIWAFNEEQLAEGMEKLGVKSKEELISIYAGMIIKKSDLEAFKEMNRRHKKEFTEAIEADTTGEGFIKEMFLHELANFEYTYTLEVDDTLDALGFTVEDLNKNKALLHGLQIAMKELVKENE